jgi:hypothetical protein
MTILDKARARLQEQPELKYRETLNSIVVEAPSLSGFSVSLHAANNEFVVHFDGWHKHFNNEDAALNCFAFGLLGRCRLKVCRRWKIEYRWTLESLTDRGWEEDSTTGLLFFPFWGSREITYRENWKATESPVSKPAY